MLDERSRFGVFSDDSGTAEMGGATVSPSRVDIGLGRAEPGVLSAFLRFDEAVEDEGPAEVLGGVGTCPLSFDDDLRDAKPGFFGSFSRDDGGFEVGGLVELGAVTSLIPADSDFGRGRPGFLFETSRFDEAVENESPAGLGGVSWEALSSAV